jgi:transcriptional regulator with XRE-family HTH domain
MGIMLITNPKRRRTISMTLDVKKLEELRARSGLTQDQVAGRAKISLRTVQRAFAGHKVRPYMANHVAKALGADLSDVLKEAHSLGEGISRVNAWKCDGGMQLLRLWTSARIHDIRVEAEPDSATAEEIAAIVSMLEAMYQRPKTRYVSLEDNAARDLTKAQQVRLAADFGARLARLQSHNVAVYAGGYTAFERDMYYSPDDFMWLSREKPEDLAAAVAVIARDVGQRTYVHVSNRSAADPALSASQPTFLE